MDGADIGHHPDLRLGNITQELDLAGDIKSHFKHGAFVAHTKFQNRKRQPDLVVQVAGAAQCAISCAKHFSNGLFGRGFPNAASDAHNAEV